MLKTDLTAYIYIYIYINKYVSGLISLSVRVLDSNLELVYKKY